MRQLIFGIVLVYTWALGMFLEPATLLESTRGSTLYMAIVAPAVILVLANIDSFFASHYDRSTLALVLFAVIVAIVSVLRGDLPTVISVVPLCATLIAIHNARLAPTLGLINGLFLASIVATFTLQVFGSPRYGLIPGHSADVAWRISLFPHNVTPSWLFALIVIFTNYFRNPEPVSRRVMIAVALYFIAFSASRTSLIVLMMASAFLVLTQLWRFRNRRLFRWLLPLSVGLFVVALSTQALLTVLVGVNDPLLNAVLFRSEAGASDVEAATTSIYRTIIWGAHFNAFVNNPLFGLGTMNFADLALGTEDVTGSESFLTGLFGRTGSLALLFVYFIYRNSVDAATRGDRFVYCLMILFAITSLTYGSYIVPYDFIFLLLFGTMNIGPVRPAPIAAPDSSDYRNSLTNSA